ncbi:hypothetical protein [Arthrobacter sp. UCD-GKA]|uniref:hypothetical protein n=1 Tax=Arthrobacter sp. UCD-GKA TaxID=1913576 RepID=UPI001586FB79|nr:hypothetical protein [Arthrobacter sp. UCD-GKA]
MADRATNYAYSRTEKPEIAWDDKEAKEVLMFSLVIDVLTLLAAVVPESQGRRVQ